MARKNIPLTIHRPGVKEITPVVFVANAAGNTNVIPFRYAFADIENLTALRAAGFFRHALTGGVVAVSSDLGGSASVDVATNLGYQLPPTEKLILLCKVNTALTADKHIAITVKGSHEYGIADKAYVIAEDNVNQDTDATLVVAGDIFEIDLYDFGLLLNSGEITITADGNAAAHADDASVSFALIARAG